MLDFSSATLDCTTLVRSRTPVEVTVQRCLNLMAQIELGHIVRPRGKYSYLPAPCCRASRHSCCLNIDSRLNPAFIIHTIIMNSYTMYEFD